MTANYSKKLETLGVPQIEQIVHCFIHFWGINIETISCKLENVADGPFSYRTDASVRIHQLSEGHRRKPARHGPATTLS
jgi:hypothetical protein